MLYAARFIAGLAFAFALGCAPAEPEPLARNLLLVSIDTLRADHLGCYGYERATSPRIDAFAARGAVFEDASATCSWTIPSHFSMLTGLYPRAHGVVGWQKPIPADIPTLASTLSGYGFETAAFVNVSTLDAERGFGRGFDTYAIEKEKPSPAGAARAVLGRAEEWLRGRGEGRYCLFVHLFDVHSSYDSRKAHEGLFVSDYDGGADGTTRQLKQYRQGAVRGWGDRDREHLIDLYDAGIHQLDDALGAFLESLDASGELDETLVVITSDHGEEFLEHGDVLHGRTLHQELLRVPLVFVGPGIPPGARVSEATSLVDVVPTALARLGIETPVAADGVDLTAAWRGESLPPRLLFAETDKWFGQDKSNYRRAVRRGRFTLHYDHGSGTRTLYDLVADPGELVDVSAEHPELAATLWERLQAYMESGRDVGDTIELSDDQLEAIERLGYL